MTEIKWGILFTALFLCIIVGTELHGALYAYVMCSELNLNMQLDTCVEDTLEETEFKEENGVRFTNAKKTGNLLKKNLRRALDISNEKEEYLEKAVRAVFLYEETGFYFYEQDKDEWIWNEFEEENMEKRIRCMESVMHKITGRIFTFPEISDEKFANSLDGTGILLIFEPQAKGFAGTKYNRLILSGAKVEKLW